MNARHLGGDEETEPESALMPANSRARKGLKSSSRVCAGIGSPELAARISKYLRIAARGHIDDTDAVAMYQGVGHQVR